MMKNGRTVQLSALLICSTLLSAACGGVNSGLSSDPTKSYDIGPVVPLHDEKPRTQKVLERSYSIEVEKDATFIEGETASFKIRARVFFPVLSFDLKLSGLPDDVAGVNLVRSATEAGTWILTWSAPKGFIASDRNEREVRYKLELADVRSSDSSVESLFRSINRTQDFSFSVRRTGKTPQIVKSDLGVEVAQGAVVPFTVEVMDPASYEGFAPRVDIYFQGTNKTEAGYEANGATYVRNETLPKHLGGGLWRFEYLFDAKNNDVGAQLDRNGKKVEGATHLQSRFLIKAYSASGGVSGEKLQTVKIRFAKAQTLVEEKPKCEAPAAAKPAAAKPASKTEPKTAAATKTGKGN